MHTLAELLRWRARRHPDLAAMREPGREVTWAELDERTTALANGLIEDCGVQPGDRVAILDPPLVELAVKEHPDWSLHQVALKTDPKYPIMSTKYNVIMGIKKDQIELGQAVDSEIRKLWASCDNKKIMAKYGVINPDFFVPPTPDPRIGVDRAADYKAPTLPANCPP